MHINPNTNKQIIYVHNSDENIKHTLCYKCFNDYNPNYEPNIHINCWRCHNHTIKQTQNNINNIPNVESAVNAANAAGAPGYDFINVVHLKINRFEINILLCNMFNTWNKLYIIPYYNRLGSVVGIQKEIGANIPSKYRPITLLPAIFKIYERMILWRMSDTCKIRKSLHTLQGGNRHTRGVPEQLGTLNLLSETASNNKKPLFTAFLDIKKAFDTVWRKGLFYKLLTDFNLSPNLCKITQAIYENSHSSIRDRPFINKPYQMINGVLQGSVLSPVLFAVFVNDLIIELQNSNCGALSPDLNQLIAAIFYCDDVVLTANTIDNLQTLLKICEKHSQKWCYTYNGLIIKSYNDLSTNYFRMKIPCLPMDTIN